MLRYTSAHIRLMEHEIVPITGKSHKTFKDTSGLIILFLGMFWRQLFPSGHFLKMLFVSVVWETANSYLKGCQHRGQTSFAYNH